MKKLVIIDGNAILHRAFHALPPLTNKKGEIVNAVYGFFSMFFNVLQSQKPDYVIACFDRPKPTFRQSLYVGYQQNRPAMSDDLVPQIGKLHTLLKQMNVTIFEVDGYEADDLIGTFSKQALIQQKDIEVIIVSGDRDLLQLVNSHVKMLAPITGVTNTILYDSEKVQEKFGILPSQIVDYKALVGDASDGYPGVSGIGPKTAAELLIRYHTLEGIYKHIAELHVKNSQKLIEGSEHAALCKKLATIVTDAPVTLYLEKCQVSDFTIDSLREGFVDEGFKTLTNRLNGVFGKATTGKKEQKEKSGQLGLLE